MNLAKQSFYFRADSETGVKRDTVEVEIPQLEVDDLIELLSDPDNTFIHAWVLDGVNSQISSAARKQVDENPEFVTGMELDTDKLEVSYLATLPKSSRGLGLTKEDWEAFVADYVEVMVTKLDKPQEKAELAARLLKGKYAQVKMNKDVIQSLVTLLSNWYASTDSAVKFAPIYEYLTQRADTLLNEEVDLISAL